MSDATRFHLGRQPIVAGERRLVGWAVFFATPAGERLRPGPGTSEEYLAAASAFVRHAHWESFLGGGRVVLAADRRLIFSDVIEHMPRNRVVLGLSPDEPIDSALAHRLHDLHGRRGTRMLFRGYSRRDPRDDLLDLADLVEIDGFGPDDDARDGLVRRAKRRHLQVLAEGVDRDRDFMRLRDAGFDLFQGQSHTEPSASGETLANEDGRILIRLLAESHGELEIDSVTRTLAENPGLEEALLRLVNSLELARAQRIECPGQALILIGAKGLRRWLSLLLFQVGARHGSRGPLFRSAASRARMMELLALGGDGRTSIATGKDRAEAAFLVGILSLVHVLLGTDRDAAIADLDLPFEIAAALSEFAGELGRLLRLVICLDRADFVEVAEVAGELAIDPATLRAMQCDAQDWVFRLD